MQSMVELNLRRLKFILLMPRGDTNTFDIVYYSDLFASNVQDPFQLTESTESHPPLAPNKRKTRSNNP